MNPISAINYRPNKYSCINIPGQSQQNISFKASGYEVIDLNKDPRAEFFKLIQTNNDSNYSFTVQSDVTNLISEAKKRNIKPTHAMLYMIMKTMNEIPEFKMRKANGEVRKYDKIDVITAVTREDRNAIEQYNGINSTKLIEYSEKPSEFFEDAGKKFDEAKHRKSPLFPKELFGDDKSYVQVISVPWFKFSAYNPMSIEKSRSIPSVTYGKFEDTNGKIIVPVTAYACHDFIDGYHFGQFFNKFEKNCKNAKEIFKDIDLKSDK